MDSFTVQTTRRNEMIDVTAEVRASLARSGLREGFGVVFCPHSTAAVTLNEHFDPAVVHDMVLWLNRAVPAVPVDSGFLDHGANSDAHIKATLVGCSLALIVDDGDLVIGRWQGVILCEFDGPRTRTVQLKWVGERKAGGPPA
jgi:secondary thiamine-phosphate synthase enzyme